MANIVQNPFDTQPQNQKTSGLIANAQTADKMSPPAAPPPAQPLNYQPATPLHPSQVDPAYVAERPPVDQATETTQGQLVSLLDGDSPVLQRARTLATQQANSRGLLNSSMAAEAGTAAVLDRAVPIAQADAGIYDARARGNAAAGNESMSQGANISSQMRLQQGQQSFQGEQAGLDRQQQHLQRQFQEIQGQLDREQQLALTQLQSNLQDQAVPKTFAMNVAISAQNAIQQILGNADLTPDAKRGAIANLIAAANAQMAWASTFYNTELPLLQDIGASTMSPWPGGPIPPPPFEPIPGLPGG